MLHKWPSIRASDLALSVDGKLLVSVCQNQKIHVYNMDSKEEIMLASIFFNVLYTPSHLILLIEIVHSLKLPPLKRLVLLIIKDM